MQMENIYPIISIGRSFGAGGRAIGRELSRILEIPFYDQELLKEAARECGFPSDVFARVDEKRPSALKRLVTQMYGVQEAFNYSANFTSENIYQAQSLVIRAIAKRGPAIFIGRTADYVLRDFPGLLKVFIHAPLSYRALKIVERGDASTEEEAIELARRKDRCRRDYYNYFTGRHWGSASNYDFSLDASLMSAQKCAEVIAFFLKLIQNNPCGCQPVI